MNTVVRRSSLLLPLTFACFVHLPKMAAADDLYDLQSKCQSKGVYSVAAKIQVDGKLQPSADAKTASLPITVRGRFKYDEIRLDDGKTANRRSLRYYHEAGAAIEVNKHRDSPKLREDSRFVLVHADAAKVSISSLHGPLTREELDLIDLPANTLLMDQLMSAEKVNVGGSWKVPDALLAKLVCVDIVSRNEVTCELSNVNKSVAEIKVGGRLNAAVTGVATEIRLNGTATFDLDHHCLTSIQLRIKERRAIGYVGPGLDVTAQLDIQITPQADSAELTPAIVKEAGESDPSTHPLALRSETGGYQLVYDRRWHVTRNETQLVVLRLIDRGELIAQCNISPLPRLDQGKTVTIEEFQAEVQKSLGKRFDKFETVAEGKGAGGLRVLKVVASGFASEVPIQWRYYLAIDPDGRRLALAYTMESDLIERFADADVAMTESIEFEATSPIPANDPEKAEAAAKN
ncbi:MAG TPA: hypothetical protein VHX65_01175 [Pirellulales bacterium]|nr:hypothetical protein [Pirellulales bacterium]